MPTTPRWKRRRRRRQRLHGCVLWCVLLAACGDGGERPWAEPDPEPKPPEARALEPELRPTAKDARIRGPLDATPSPDGAQVYYTATSHGSGDPQPGVFVVAAQGGAPDVLALGEPLIAPAAISVSLDGRTLYIADPAAGLFTLAALGGSPSPLSGTSGYTPTGLVVADVQGEYVYFTGRPPAGEGAGLFRVAAGGGAVEALAVGPPFHDPAGVAIGRRGEAYVVDSGGDAEAAGVLRVRDGRVDTFVSDIGVGFPAGIALTRDEASLLVSGLDPRTRRDVIYVVDTASAEVSRRTATVGAFAEPAGLHRAHEADVFAWADSEADESGTVYVLEP